MTIEAMKLALEALEEVQQHMNTSDWFNTRTDALRAAIEQAEKQEPVAWVYPEGLEALKSAKPWVAYGSNGDGPHSDGVQRIPLYLNNDAVAPRVEPRASESGAGFESLPASPNQPEPEPVAWMYHGIRHDDTPHERPSLIWKPEYMDAMSAEKGVKATPLYTAPRQWQGLTDEEIDELALDENGLPNSHIEFARAIEAKLKEKNHA